MTVLTICIPTIPARRSMLSRLLWTLEPQLGPNVEVLVSDGRRPMGDKLNEMFAAANGRYVVAVDDDDLVTADYVHRIAALDGPDFIGYDVLWLEEGRYAGTVKHHLDGDPLWSTLDRGVSPKCPVRTELARRVRFGNTYTADRTWSATIHEACETGSYTPAPLYVYDHWTAHMVGTSPDDPRYTNAQRDVGDWPYDPSVFGWLS
jgi:hypothetical protein